MGTDALAFPDEDSDAQVEGAGSELEAREGTGGGGGSAGGPPTLGSADEEPDRFVRFLLRLRDAVKPGKSNVAPYVSFERAKSRARDRDAAISAWPHNSDERFVEAPPEFDDVSIPFATQRDPETEDAALRWQQQAEAILLLARTGDAVVTLLAAQARMDDGFGEIVDRTQPVVSITPIPRLLRRLRPHLFPWRVEVRTTDPEFFTKRLPRHADWLGVGVDVVRGGRVEPQGHCRVPGGMEGTVAGFVGNGMGNRHQVTCAHVVSDGCTCARWRATLPAGVVSDDPDAALIDGESTCFIPQPAEVESIPCATQLQLLDLALGRTGVRRVGGRRLGRSGTVTGASTRGGLSAPATFIYAIGRGRLSRFPALTIVPRGSPFSRLLGPIGRRAFSKNGDSGSWVLDDEDGVWVGMVVAGESRSGYAVAVNALELTRHLRVQASPAVAEEGQMWLR